MSAEQMARIFHARRVGKGKWRAQCPIHGGRHSGPLSIAESKPGVDAMIFYCFGGCDAKDVLASKGLSLSDLYQTSKRPMTPDIARRLADEEALSRLERQYGLSIMAVAMWPEERYWRVVEQRLFEHIYDLRNTLHPEERRARERESQVQQMIQEYGWDELWECVP